MKKHPAQKGPRRSLPLSRRTSSYSTRGPEVEPAGGSLRMRRDRGVLAAPFQMLPSAGHSFVLTLGLLLGNLHCVVVGVRDRVPFLVAVQQVVTRISLVL